MRGVLGRSGGMRASGSTSVIVHQPTTAKGMVHPPNLPVATAGGPVRPSPREHPLLDPTLSGGRMVMETQSHPTPVEVMKRMASAPQAINKTAIQLSSYELVACVSEAIGFLGYCPPPPLCPSPTPVVTQ